MSFRVSIVCLNSQYVHSSLAPWCLLAGIRAYGEGIEARVIEGTVNERQERLLERITEEPAELFAFCCYIWNISTVASLCEALKKKMPKAGILWGGPEVGYTPKETLEEYPVTDYVLSGAGERSLAQVCTALSRSEPVAEIPGLTTRVSYTPPVPLWDPPSPYTEEYFAALKGRMAYLATLAVIIGGGVAGALIINRMGLSQTEVNGLVIALTAAGAALLLPVSWLLSVSFYEKREF